MLQALRNIGVTSGGGGTKWHAQATSGLKTAKLRQFLPFSAAHMSQNTTKSMAKYISQSRGKLKSDISDHLKITRALVDVR